tara:strand:+ start:1979 stop:4228 length:2250 start_codon:yes stop_codon:yes gene_type:complete
MKINKFYLMNVFLVVVLLFIGMDFISSQELVGDPQIFNELTDIGAILDSENKIIGEGVTLTLFEGGGGEITFSGIDPNVKINENLFTNIVPQNKARLPSYINFNEKGEIVKVFFRVNDNGGIYNLGGSTFYAPPDSIVNYKSGEPPEVEVVLKEIPEDTIIKDDDLPSLKGQVVYKGRDFTLYKGEVLGSNENLGRVTISNGKIIKVWEGTNARINGIEHQVDTGDLEISYEENFDPSKLKDGNYFNYGRDRIALGGNGFTSSLKKGNDIFPEYIENKYANLLTEKKGRLEFTPKGGNLEVTKNSPDNSPLALKIKANGKINIKNGRWNLEADGKNIYADVDSDFPLSADMRFNYIDNNGKPITYDLDVDSIFTRPISNEELLIIKKRKDKRSIEEKNIEEEMYYLKIETPEIELVQKIESELKFYREEISLYKEDLENFKDFPDSVKEIEKSIEELNQGYLRLLEKRQGYSEIDDKFQEFAKLEKDKKLISELISDDNEELKTKVELGVLEYGAFGEILTSEDGNSQVSYPEFVEGFPIIKNTDVLKYSFEGGKVKTTIYGGNINILAGGLIPDSNSQTCSDTQIELRALWELEQLREGNQKSIKFKIANGEELSYNSDGTYTIWGQGKVVTKQFNPQVAGNEFVKWIENIQVYSNTGSLRASLNRVEDLNNLRPGDIITLSPDKVTGYGHTKAIKEILLIDGIKYYRVFAGSDPVIDARIYPKLMNQIELEESIKSGNAVVSRFGAD